MDVNIIEGIGNDLLSNFKLDELGWRFGVNSSTRAVGICYPQKKLITFSRVFKDLPYSEIKDTILHEIAHALDYIRHRNLSHGPSWKRICQEIGARPERLKKVPQDLIVHKYSLHCEDCGKDLGGANRRGSYIHKNCGGDVIFTENKKENR